MLDRSSQANLPPRAPGDRNMIRGLFLSLVVGLGAFSSLVRAQNPASQEELRFVEELRRRGDTKLARDYLERLRKKPPADLAPLLPVEIARTDMILASEEVDT